MKLKFDERQMNKKECKICDYENPVRKWRARWHCPKCDRDYSLEYLLLNIELWKN